MPSGEYRRTLLLWWSLSSSWFDQFRGPWSGSWFGVILGNFSIYFGLYTIYHMMGTILREVCVVCCETCVGQVLLGTDFFVYAPRAVSNLRHTVCITSINILFILFLWWGQHWLKWMINHHRVEYLSLLNCVPNAELFWQQSQQKLNVHVERIYIAWGQYYSVTGSIRATKRDECHILFHCSTNEQCLFAEEMSKTGGNIDRWVSLATGRSVGAVLITTD